MIKYAALLLTSVFFAIALSMVIDDVVKERAANKWCEAHNSHVITQDNRNVCRDNVTGEVKDVIPNSYQY